MRQRLLWDHLTVDAGNLSTVFTALPEDQMARVKEGMTISVWTSDQDPSVIGGEREENGVLTVWHPSNEAAVSLHGRPSVWGTWDPERLVLVTDDGVAWDAASVVGRSEEE